MLLVISDQLLIADSDHKIPHEVLYSVFRTLKPNKLTAILLSDSGVIFDFNLLEMGPVTFYLDPLDSPLLKSTFIVAN